MGHYTKNPVVLIYFLVLVVLQFQTHPAAVFAAATSVEKIESSSESSSSSPFWNEKNKESETSSFDFDEVQQQQQHEQRIESSSSLIADLNFLFHEELKKLQVNKKKNSDYYYKTKRKDDSPFHDTSRLLTPYGPARRMLDKQAKKLHHLDPSSETTMRKTKKKMFADDHHQERNFRMDFWKEVALPSSDSSSGSKEEDQLFQKEKTKFLFDESLLNSIEEISVENTLPTRKETTTTSLRRLQTIGAPSTSPAGGGGGVGSFQPSPIGTDVQCPLDTAIPITYDDNGIIIAGSTIGEPANLITDVGCSSSDGSPTAWYTFTTDQAATVVLTTCSPNTDFDTYIYVYEEIDAGACEVSCIISNDDHPLGVDNQICPPPNSSLESLVTFESGPSPTTYYVAVSGFDAAGSFDLLLGFVVEDASPTPSPSSLTPPSPTPPQQSIAPTLGPGPTPTPPSPTLSPGPTLCTDLENARQITYDPAGMIISGSTAGGTDAALPEGCGVGFTLAPIAWFRIPIAEEDLIIMTTCSPNTNFDTVLAVYEATNPQNECELSCVAKNDDHEFGPDAELCSPSDEHSGVIIETALPESIYYVAVTGFSESESGPFELIIFPQDSPPTSVPGSCPPLSDAIPIDYDPVGVLITGTTTGAPANLPPIEGCTPGDITSPTVWYQLTTDDVATIVVTTCSPSTAFDTLIHVYRGDPQAECGLECIGGDDDHDTDLDFCSTSTLHSIFLFDTTPVDTYYIAVSGFSSQEFGAFELLVLTVPDETPPPATSPSPPTSALPTPGPGPSLPTTPPPAGDDCPLDSAIPITYDPNGVFLSGSTAGSPANLPAVEGCGESTDSPTVWYQFTSPETVLIALTTCSPNTDFDTILVVYSSDSVADCNLVCVGENDDHGFGSELELCAPSELHSLVFVDGVAGETYYVAVTGFDSTQFGLFDLLLLPLPEDAPTPSPSLIVPVPRPTVAPTIAAPVLQPTTAPLAPPPTPAPVAPVPGPEMSIEEADIAIDVGPVPGPFVEEGNPIVEDGSESFFRSMFGDIQDQVVNVELQNFEMMNGRRRRRATSTTRNTQASDTVRFFVRVLATYDNSNDDFQSVLEGFVADNPELYIESLQDAEAESGSQQSYFAQADTAAVADIPDDKDTPPPAPISPDTPAPQPGDGDEGGSNTAAIAGGVAAGVVAIAAIIAGVIFFKRKKPEEESGAAANKEDTKIVEDNGGQQYSNIQYDENAPKIVTAEHVEDGPPEDIEGDISKASSVVFVATGVKTSPETKVGISLARRQQEGCEDVILLSQISDTSIFAGQGLREGMIVNKINDIPVRTVEEASSIIRDYEGMMTIEAELEQIPTASVETMNC